jgi:hypothetical protein
MFPRLYPLRKAKVIEPPARSERCRFGDGSFLREKPRISGATPDFPKNGVNPRARYDPGARREPLGNLGPPQAARGPQVMPHWMKRRAFAADEGICLSAL